MGIPQWKSMTDDELLGQINIGTSHGDIITLILKDRMFGRLIEALNSNSASANKLSGKLFWLNAVITLATAVYATATVIELFRKSL